MTELERKIKKVERTIEILNNDVWSGNYSDIDELFDHIKHEEKTLEKLKKRLTNAPKDEI